MDEYKDIETRMPLVVLHEITVLPNTTVHFNVKDAAIVKAIDKAMRNGKEVLLVTSRTGEWTGDVNQLYPIGVVGCVKQMMRMAKEIVSVRVETTGRALYTLIREEDDVCPDAEIEWIPGEDDTVDTVQTDAYIQVIRGILQEEERAREQKSRYLYDKLMAMDSLYPLVYAMCEYMEFDYKEKQEVLQQPDKKRTADKFISLAKHAIDVYKLKTELQGKLKQAMSKRQQEYMLQEELRLIHEKLGDDNAPDDAEEYRKRLKKLACTKEVRVHIEREIGRFAKISPMSSESAVLRSYIETMLSYPWGKTSKLCNKLDRAITVLEADHYGLTKVKERVIDTLAVQMLSEDVQAPILCLVGPPGTGKTSIARSIARATGRTYERICLGGVHDEAELRGHRKTYVGAMPGRIATAMTHADTQNPLLLLDEVDKIGKDYKGDASAALLEILDSEQNQKFIDHYFEVPIDLSKVLFVATANDATLIPKPLLDRMELITVSSYTANEKLHIAKDYLVTKQIRKNGLTKRQFKIEDAAIETIISRYTREAGVRTLERLLGKLCQKAAREIVLGQARGMQVKTEMLRTLLGTEVYPKETSELEDQIGSVTGLAWTAVGGDTLQIEVSLLEGRGALILTGNLGDVMKESAQIAVSYVRKYMDARRTQQKKNTTEKLAVPVCGKHYFEKHDVHIHVPEGATPKDGPSAGVTIVTALYSALTGIRVRGDVAMTGEITLLGRVLAIGGLKEKLLAAKLAGKRTVIVPEENRAAVEEIEQEIKEGLTITYARTIADVWECALQMPKEETI